MQAAAIPLARTKSGSVEVCLIRRRDSAAWGIPKGFIDPGHTPGEAALTEAYEEAGVSGRLLGESIGSYLYTKRNVRYSVAVFLMEVLEEETTWPEMRLRLRQWHRMDEALSLLKRHPVHPLLPRVAHLVEAHFQSS